VGKSVLVLILEYNTWKPFQLKNKYVGHIYQHTTLPLGQFFVLSAAQLTSHPSLLVLEEMLRSLSNEELSPMPAVCSVPSQQVRPTGAGKGYPFSSPNRISLLLINNTYLIRKKNNNKKMIEIKSITQATI
jgi:hypothetical protein